MGEALPEFRWRETMEPSGLEREGPHDERCLCGNLLAKIDPGGIEILCRRCKRIHRIPWEDGEKVLDRSKSKAVPMRS